MIQWKQTTFILWEKEKERGTECIVKEIMSENFPRLGKETDIQIHEATQTPNKLNLNRFIPRDIIIKLSKDNDKKRIVRITTIYILKSNSLVELLTPDSMRECRTTNKSSKNSTLIRWANLESNKIWLKGNVNIDIKSLKIKLDLKTVFSILLVSKCYLC